MLSEFCVLVWMLRCQYETIRTQIYVFILIVSSFEVFEEQSWEDNQFNLLLTWNILYIYHSNLLLDHQIILLSYNILQLALSFLYARSRDIKDQCSKHQKDKAKVDLLFQNTKKTANQINLYINVYIERWMDTRTGNTNTWVILVHYNETMYYHCCANVKVNVTGIACYPTLPK